MSCDLQEADLRVNRRAMWLERHFAQLTYLPAYLSRALDAD